MADPERKRPTISESLANRVGADFGDENVFTHRYRLAEYTGACRIPSDDTFAAAAGHPTITDQVRCIGRLASKHQVPVWPLSQGRNLGHGDPAPRMRGAIQLQGDLQGVPALYFTPRTSHMVLGSPIPIGMSPFTSKKLTEIGCRTGMGACAARAAIWGHPDVVEPRRRRLRTGHHDGQPSRVCGWV